MRVCVHAFVAVFSRDLRPANHTLGRHSSLRNCTLLNWLGLHYKMLVFPSNQCQNVTPHVVNMCGSRSRHSLVYSPWAPLFRHLLPSRENSFRRILEGKKKPVTIACLQSQKLTQRNTLNKTSFLTLLTLRLCPGVDTELNRETIMWLNRNGGFIVAERDFKKKKSLDSYNSVVTCLL